MKRRTLTFWVPALILAFTFAAARADLNLKKFSLEPGYNKVMVRWEVQGENQIKGYEVQRGLNRRDFSKVAFVKSKIGAALVKKYEYVDQTVFKQSQSGRTYYYRLKIVKTDGSFTYSKVEQVTPTISSARQTWGSIKAMFR